MCGIKPGLRSIKRGSSPSERGMGRAPTVGEGRREEEEPLGKVQKKMHRTMLYMNLTLV